MKMLHERRAIRFLRSFEMFNSMVAFVFLIDPWKGQGQTKLAQISQFFPQKHACVV